MNSRLFRNLINPGTRANLPSVSFSRNTTRTVYPRIRHRSSPLSPTLPGEYSCQTPYGNTQATAYISGSDRSIISIYPERGRASERPLIRRHERFFFSPFFFSFPSPRIYILPSDRAPRRGGKGQKNLRNVSSSTTSPVAPVNSSEYVSISCAHTAVFYFAVDERKKIHSPARDRQTDKEKERASGREKEGESGTRARKLYFLWKKCCVFRAVGGRASLLFVHRAKRASPIALRARARALSTRRNCAADWRELSAANALQTLPFVRIE